MSRSYLPLSDPSDDRAEMIIIRRDPDSVSISTSTGSSKVLGTPNQGSAILNSSAI